MSTSTQLSNKRFVDDHKFANSSVLSSSLNSIGKISNAVKAVAREATAGKNINFNKLSHEHSPGKLMNLAKSEHCNTFDSVGADSDGRDYWDKWVRKMKLERKQSQSIPLTEIEKRELNYVNVRMMIFDVRYEGLQEHGTLPSWFRFPLKEKLTDDDIDKFIEQYSCCKETASTICILGAGVLTGNLDNLNGVERFNVKAINKIINKMEKSGFVHITTAEDGFEKWHELCKLHDLRLQEHYPDECYYWLQEADARDRMRQEGALRIFAGKFTSLYEKMGQKLRDLVYKK